MIYKTYLHNATSDCHSGVCNCLIATQFNVMILNHKNNIDNRV